MQITAWWNSFYYLFFKLQICAEQKAIQINFAATIETKEENLIIFLSSGSLA